MAGSTVPRKFRPSVATVLVGAALLILLLPLASLLFFRIYENQLVRETEAELISQAAVLGAAYKEAVRRHMPDHDGFGTPIDTPGPEVVEERYAPVLPQIDLPSDPVLSRRQRARPAEQAPDPALLAAGTEITALFIEAQRATLSGMRLLDPQGVVIAGRAEIGQSLAHVSEVRDALRGVHRSVLRERISDQPAPPVTSISRGTGIRVFVAFPVIENGRLWGVVYMSRTPNSILHHLYGSRYRLIALAVLIVGLTLLVAWLTSRTLLRPIRQLSGQARALAEGRRSSIEPLHRYGTRELATLGQSFADMAATLERRNQYLRDFATHVSHEFKTPLTAIRGAAELLIEHQGAMSESERARFLSNIDADAARLKALVEQLIELARADTTHPVAESLDLCAAVVALAGEFPIVVPVVEGKSPCKVRMTRETFRMIAGNLIANSEQAGATEVRISVERKPDSIEMTFTDNGHGVSQGNREKIFDPFFTTRREAGGTGLGLGIVRSLVQAHNGALELRNSDTGASFALRFRA